MVDSRRVLLPTLGALMVAALLLVTVVLPAEYGIDPLGTGAALGLTAMSEARARVIEPQPAGLNQNAIRFVLGPYEMVEYKYRLAARSGMLFSWTADGEVLYDFHSEPDGAPEGYAESFEKGRAAAAHGNFVAPFSGIHGWFWENSGSKDVTVTLTTAGNYTEALEFSVGGTRSYPVTTLTPQ